ncbi:hypothetical protein ASPWEDRAFT_103407 [Aspergillus wentii DTO 134E9]|uniref:Uncharacterized protein n=1 Tax=Aspergillus wentii DTO 134E9 TaxID=1073089 RepID=A0A1L9RTJ5_ASPWE|nr:uncharacterized protein ASPWEDRAFT_103407 [Aspergillus wentii DTO 134E9]KAI9933854.1 hypothetical protein MW887_004926 [Aspergillus wentii]OJJ38203.1 hypothetical protein ASPWEDRAFT_103407 [Aspergillus wentii DTO 134E9]
MKLNTSTSQFLMRYTGKNPLPPVAARYVAAHSHPIRPKIVHMYANRDPNTLWWRVSVNPLQSSFKRVVRSWGARRARTAFMQALKARGFDREGRRVVHNTTEPGTKADVDFNLRGSLEISVRPQCIKEGYAAVQQEINFLLDDLLQQLKNNQTKLQEKKKGTMFDQKR